MSEVVAENNVLTSVKEFFEDQREPPWFRLASFAQMVELFVLAEKVYVDEKSLRISGSGDFFTFLHPEMANLIVGLNVSDEERADALTFAEGQSTAFSGVSLDEWEYLQVLRGNFYLYLALTRGLPYFPGERRVPYLSVLESVSADMGGYKRIVTTFERLRREAYTQLRDSGLLRYRYSPLPYPPLFAYLVGRANSLFELFEIAVDLRDSADARAFRAWSRDLVAAETDERWLDAAKMFLEVEKHLRCLFLDTPQAQEVQLQLSFPAALGVGRNFRVGRRKRHLLFLKQVLSNQPSPSALSDKLRDLMRLR